MEIKVEDKTEVYISELEDKIVALSLKLKGKTSQLDSVNKANAKLIAKLIHNLKNPVGIAYSFSDMILDSIDTYTPDKLEKHLQIINKSASFSLQLLNTFALFRELQSSSFELCISQVNYIEILNNVINKFNESALENNIFLIKDFLDEPIYLNIDAQKIEIALSNILSNAIRFSNENSNIKIKLVVNSDTVETLISDEGIGVSETDLQTVFKEFFVVNTYSNDKQKCIGLGLPIACKIFKHHKGLISMQSALNKGTTIAISLPVGGEE